jgi:hypothetical protein
VGEVDVAVHPPIHHPLDPFADGRLITRGDGTSVEVVVADDRILLDCGFLWDVVADQAVFRSLGVKLTPPVPKLALESNFNVAAGVAVAGLDFPSNRPSQFDTYPMCQHWTLELTIGNRKCAYKIGAYRPSINAMEATRHGC